ncbi:MAG: alpha/beta hydrolase [Bacteroidetes bacterium]|nr:alpha/beta hydrolase [Bacteroidota bacterium]
MKQLSTLFFLLIIFFSCSCGSDPKTVDATVQAKDTLEVCDSITIKNKNATYISAYDKALTLWKIPFEEKDLTTSFGTAHVIECGPPNGKPLVLLHGMNASSTMWYPNIKSLSQQYRIYAIDFLLEPGKSCCQKKVSSTDEIVKWYYEIFDQLQLKTFNMVGASRGGWLALNIALYSQTRINKLVLLSPAQTFIWIRPMPDIMENITYSINPKRKHLRNVLKTMTSDVDNIEQLFIDQYYIATEDADMMNKCILQMTPFSDEQLKSLKVPVLVLIGDNDIINNNKSLKQVRKLLPDVETEMIRNAGHFLSIDQKEIVNKRIIDFLNEGNNLSSKKR